MFAKINNEIIEKYPYTIGDLRKDNPNTSFPSIIPDDVLAEFGVIKVNSIDKPITDYTKNVIESDPVFDGSSWVQVWVVADASQEEINERIAIKSNEIRSERDAKLASSDWTQLSDATVDKAAWSVYRQALRDIPQQEGFPYNVIFPATP